jgi:hypothetical protein
MRIRRTYPILLAVVVIAAAVTVAVELRKNAPPEPARLLPGADAFLYLDLKTVRRATAGHELPPVNHDPEYERFIQQTGFQFERDLDEAAFAVHFPASWPGGGTGGSSSVVSYSEVFVGKFHAQRVTSYLRQIAQSVENYNAIDIFTVPVEGRLLRVTVLNADSLAASNQQDPAVIKGIIDHSRRLASPFGGPLLLRQYYKHVQLASLAWVVARIDPAAPDFPGSSFFDKPATLVFSASALSPLHPLGGVLRIRSEAFAQSSDAARALADKVNAFVAMTRSAEDSTDGEMKALLDGTKVKQDGDRVMLNASVPIAFLQKMLSGSPPANEVAPAPSRQTPEKSR